MKIRYNAVFVSSVLLSICLLSLVPASIHWVSTWKELNIAMPGVSVQNFFMPLGFYSLCLEMIGMIVLWTGYLKRERSAWFVMLIITLFFVFPLNGLKMLLEMHASILSWPALLHGVRAGWWPMIWTLIGAFTFLLMLVGLFLPFHVFFLRTSNLQSTVNG